MKIGILTLSLHTNYGGILQAFALKTVLEKSGHEVWLIDTQLSDVSRIRKIWRLAKEIYSFLKGDVEMINPKRLRNKAYKDFTKPFIDRNIPNITETYKTVKGISKGIEKYGFEVYIVGSDQIWNTKYFKNIEIAYFSFLNGEKVKRISYAPSFGTDIWRYSDIQTRNCKELIKSFNGLSVREDIGVKFCQQHFDKEATLVLDPTMLLNAQDYIQLLPQNEQKINRGLFTYVLDLNSEKKDIIESVGRKKNLKIFQLEIMEGFDSCPLEWRTKSSVEDWIKSFLDADFIITDSFHGTVFSIIFNKPFFTLINFQRGAVRFTSLLNLFNLSERIISSPEELTNEKLNAEISWTFVNKKLQFLKGDSMSFLYKHIEN